MRVARAAGVLTIAALAVLPSCASAVVNRGNQLMGYNDGVLRNNYMMPPSMAVPFFADNQASIV